MFIDGEWREPESGDVRELREPATGLLVLTSFEIFDELRRRGGLSEPDVTGTLQAAARAALQLP